MSRSMDGWSELHRMGWSVLLAAFALGCGITLATAQQVQEVPKTTPKSATSAGTGGESSWIKVCTKDEKNGNKQVCLVRHEGLEPKTGAILIAAAVRIIEGEEKQHLLVNVTTAYSLVMAAGVQIKIDEGEPTQLQYAVCFPTSCQVQMEMSKEFVEEMRKGKQMFIAAVNRQQKTMFFPLPLTGFSKTSDGAPVDNRAYQEARAQMMRASREHQAELARQAEAQRTKQQAGGQPQAEGTVVQPAVPNATIAPAPQ
jgi:invasion protein IalB